MGIPGTRRLGLLGLLEQEGIPRLAKAGIRELSDPPIGHMAPVFHKVCILSRVLAIHQHRQRLILLLLAEQHPGIGGIDQGAILLELLAVLFVGLAELILLAQLVLATHLHADHNGIGEDRLRK